MTSRRDFLKAGAAMSAMAVAAPVGEVVHRGLERHRRHAGNSVDADSAATYTARIKFTGLCLFVVDKEKNLRVLLPATHYPHTHHARFYHTGWNDKGEVANMSDITVPATRTTVCLPSTPACIAEPGYENLSAIWSGHYVDEELAAGDFDSDLLGGRFTIPGGKLATPYPWLGTWKASPNGVEHVLRMAPSMTWECEIDKSFHPFLNTGLPPVQLQNTNSVEIEVRYVKNSEHGKCPKPPKKPSVNSKAPHFPFLRDLFTPPLTGDLLFVDAADPPASCEKNKGITPFSCMIGGGDIGP